MTKRPTRLPALDRSRLEALNNRLQAIGTPNESRIMIMRSLNAAANEQSETPEMGMASLPTARQNIARSSASAAAGIFSFSNSFAIPFDEQLDFNEELATAQAESNKLEWAIVLGLLAYFLFPRSEVKTLYDSILNAYVSAWQLAIKEQAGRYGCPSARIGNPPRASLSQMKEWAKRDSDSIAETYDKEAQNALRKLYDANPLGTVSYYLVGMAEWANTRQLRKSLTIGIHNVQAGYQLGMQDFHVNNSLKTKYAFSGMPPVCPICVRLFSMGHVDYETMASNGAPVHVNCPHYWVSVNTYMIDCAGMWTGV